MPIRSNKFTPDQIERIRKFFDHVAEYHDSILAFAESGQRDLAKTEATDALEYLERAKPFLEKKGIPIETTEAIWAAFFPA